MLLYFDKTGFPLIALRELGYYVHLLPVAKKQFKQCDALCEAYRKASSYVDRAAPHIRSRRLLEHQFMTGVLPEEVELFCRWLGEGVSLDFDVPDSELWPRLYDGLASETIDPVLLMHECENQAAYPLIQKILDARHPTTYAELSLMWGGVIEWVCKRPHWSGRGKPRWAFYNNTYGDPRSHEISPTTEYRTRRSFPFGFRLVSPY